MNTSRDFMEKLVDKLLDRNKETIISITLEGELPVAVQGAKRVAVPALKQLGWNGRSKLFGVPKYKAHQLLGDADAVTGPWITRERIDSVPVLLVVGAGTVLLNIVRQGNGTVTVEVEPGSLDSGTN